MPLLNPKETIKEGGGAQLGEPVTLQLGGLGIRDMVRWNDGFLIIAGDFDDRFEPGAKPSRVFVEARVLSQRTSGLISAISIRRQSSSWATATRPGY